MAERRMFTQKITESDAFLDMPFSSQALYFHLCMNADDDGFVKNSKRISRMMGACDDDMRLLVAKSFVITYDTGVIVIKHWRMHNLLRKDRYKETEYTDEKSMLNIKKNGAYTLDKSQGKPLIEVVRQPNGNQMTPQDSIGKDSIDKDSIEKENTKESSSVERFEDFVAVYPKICTGYLAETEYCNAVAAGVPEEDLITAARNYAVACRKKKTPVRYIKNPENFLKENLFMTYVKGADDGPTNEKNDKRDAGTHEKSLNELLEERGCSGEFEGF